MPTNPNPNPYSQPHNRLFNASKSVLFHQHKQVRGDDGKTFSGVSLTLTDLALALAQLSEILQCYVGI